MHLAHCFGSVLFYFSTYNYTIFYNQNKKTKAQK